MEAHAHRHQRVTVKCWRMQVAAVLAEVLDKETLPRASLRELKESLRIDSEHE